MLTQNNMQNLTLEAKIEGLLYYKGDEVSKKELASLLDVTEDEIDQAIINLDNILINRGLVVVKNNNNFKLSIAKELGPLIESIHKDEISKELTKASLETLAIIIYYDGVARSEIDYIRGVNSSFIIRNLLIRGLVDKKTDPNDNRRLLYYPTIELLSFMGVSDITQLPNYDEIKTRLAETLNNQSISNETND